MRVRTFWTIENHSKDKVFYVLNQVGNKRIGDATGSGHEEGWLEAGKAIDKEVAYYEYKITFWKKKPILGIGKKAAKPKKVTTDRPVTLTMQGTVVQPEHAEFTDPEHVGPVIFMTEMDLNNTARSLVLAGLGKIPEVGGAIAAILGFLWSEQKKDLIAESEQRMKRWVQGRIDELKREKLRTTLSGLRNLLEEYHTAIDPGERHDWFGHSLTACEVAQPLFTEQEKFTPGTSALAVALGTIHLTLLRERVVHTTDIFGDAKVSLEKFKASLKKNLKIYQDYILNVAVPGELAWRQEQIVKVGIGSLFLTDWVTREVHRFSHSAASRLTNQDHMVCVKYYREQAEGSLARQLQENVVHTAKLWTLLDPDQADAQPIPLDGVSWNAALAGLGYMYGNTHKHAHDDAVSKKIGRITEVVVRAGDLIDGLEFRGVDGSTGQGGKGGTEHRVKVPEGAFLTRIETWFDYDLFAIRFHFSDGSSQGPFGKTERGSVHQTAEFPLHHVTAIGIGQRMQELRCGFTPLPDYYERLAAG